MNDPEPTPIRNCHTCAHWDGDESRYSQCVRVGTYCDLAMHYGLTPCKPETLELWEQRPPDPVPEWRKRGLIYTVFHALTVGLFRLLFGGGK